MKKRPLIFIIIAMVLVVIAGALYPIWDSGVYTGMMPTTGSRGGNTFTSTILSRDRLCAASCFFKW